jgi:hypothetical protein
MASDNDCDCTYERLTPSPAFVVGDRVVFIGHLRRVGARNVRDCLCRQPDREITLSSGQVLNVLGKPPAQLLVKWIGSTRTSYVDVQCISPVLPDPDDLPAIERWLDQTS